MRKSESAKDVSTAFFDIETKYLFHEVGGHQHMHKLGLAVAGLIIDGGPCAFYTEDNVSELFEALRSVDRIVGHNVLRFDYPVLDPYADFHVPGAFQAKTLDTLHELYEVTGHYIALDDLAHRTLGRGKTGEARMMPLLWREGKCDEVKKYCANDVELVRDIYHHARRTGRVVYTEKRRGVLLGIREVAVTW